MGQDSKIEWCHHTFNPWIGCAKVSPGCANCYAAVDSPARISRANGVELWGPDASRRMKAESGWAEPVRWNRAAEKAGERHRVFCASQADVFEDRTDLVAPRVRLFHLINETSHLDWLLLTKRPENIRAFCDRTPRSWSLAMPSNVWLGVSAEDQQRADERIPKLLEVPAAVRFLSMEPLLGPVDLRRWLPSSSVHKLIAGVSPAISWVIVGGESGPKARPIRPDWVRSIRDQCELAGVPFFFKQWGEWLPSDDESITFEEHEYEFLPWVPSDLQGVCKVGKKRAGRLLDGRTWDEMPARAGVAG